MTDEQLANLDAERATIGAMVLADSSVRAQLRAALTPLDFYRGAHRTVWEHCVALVDDPDAQLDTVSLGDRLDAHGQLDHVGGPTVIADCVADCPHPGAGLDYARTVRDLARRRHVRDEAASLSRGVGDRTIDVDTVLADHVDRMTAQRSATGVLDASRLTDRALEWLEGGETMLGWPSPWPSMADRLRIVPGWLHLVYGWPSAGKSAFLDALIVELAERHGVRSVVWSPEGAPQHRHHLRLAAIRGGTEPASWARLDEATMAMEWVEQHVSYLDHARLRQPAAILAQASALQARGGCDVLVVDPWTKVDQWDGPKTEPWDRMLQRHLDRLVAWARSHEVAVLVAAHPKQKEAGPGGRPPVVTPHDLHGGAMWRDMADAMWSIWRDHTAEPPESRRVEVHVQKVKDDPAGGQMGRVLELFRADSGRYYPTSERRLEAV